MAHIVVLFCTAYVATVAACYSENVPKSMFGASAVTDEEFDSGKIQPVCPDWYTCDILVVW